MPGESYGFNRATQYLFAYGADEPANLNWYITIGDGLVNPDQTTRASDVFATHNSALLLPATFNYNFSGSLTTFAATFTPTANFTPTYTALFVANPLLLASEFDTLLSINNLTTSLVAGNPITITFKFAGVAI